MYILILLTTVGLVNSHFHHHGEHHHGWNHHHPHQPENDLEKIKNNLIEADTDLQKYCKEHGNVSVEELYGDDRYFLRYLVTEAETTQVSVVIQHRNIHTILKKVDGSEILNNIRLLPDIVDNNQAVWLNRGNGIEISMPYRLPLKTAYIRTCGVINNNVITVPEGKLSNPNVQYRGQFDDRTKNLIS